MSSLFKFIVLVVIGALVGGATIDTWYSWFIAGPDGAFPELHDITFVQSLGIGLFTGYFSYGLLGYLGIMASEEERTQALVLTYFLTASAWALAVVYHFLLI